jgi:hypothetical protein
VEARIASKPLVIQRIGKHRAQRLKAHRESCCSWVEKPIREKI